MTPTSFIRLSFLFLFLITIPNFVFGQTEAQPAGSVGANNPKNIIKIAPLAFLHGQTPFAVESRLGYERVIGKKNSIAGSYSHLGSNPVFGFIGSVALSATLTTVLTLYGKPGKVGIVWTDTKIQTSGYRYQFQYKHFLSRKTTAPEGIYLSPHYSYAEADYEIDFSNLEIKASLKSKNRNYNVLAGYQALLGRHFVVDVFTGLGYKQKSTQIFDANGNYLGNMTKGFPLKVSSGFNLGLAF